MNNLNIPDFVNNANKESKNNHIDIDDIDMNEVTVRALTSKKGITLLTVLLTMLFLIAIGGIQ